MSPAYVVEMLRRSERDGRIAAPWSEPVKVKIARGVLKALAEFGLLYEAGRGRREIAHFRPTDGAVVYLAYELHFSGSTDSAVVQHQDWRLFGLTSAEVTASLDRLSGDGWWLAQAAGSLIRISWKHATMEAVVDALAR
jgi:hypothetical protein